MNSQIQQLLSNIILPDGRDLISSEKISALVEREDSIGFSINIDIEDAPYALELKEKCEKIIYENSTIKKIFIVLTSSQLNVNSLEKSKNLIKLKPAGIKKIILVVSCKGGVGKSTITYLLAQKLKGNFKVGILDADIYGPSIPTLFDLYDQPKISEGVMIPFEVDNIKFNSIGNLVDSSIATIWRGPMVTKNIHQLLFKTSWKELDYLLIDMPPGTGDVALSLCENYAIDSAVLVTIPGKLSFVDNKKTIDMLNKLGIKISLIVENMSASEKVDNYLGESYLENLLSLSKLNTFIKVPLNKNIYNFTLSDITL